MTTVEELRTDLAVARVAELLGVPPTELVELAAVPANDLAALRQGLADGLTAHHAVVFDAFARASGLVPTALAATITRRVIGPSLAGRIAGSMRSDRAAALMEHFEVAFLADCCRTLAPAAAARLVPAIADEVLVATTLELADRDDHATLGRFVDVLDERLLRLVLDALDQPHHLLLAGAAVDEGAALDRVVELLPPHRRLGLVRAAPAHPEAAANVLVRVRPRTRNLLLASTDALEEGDLVAVLDALTMALAASRTLRRAGASLPAEELAAATAHLGRTPTVRHAMGRLAAAARTTEESEA